jgi:hypothetical protein
MIAGTPLRYVRTEFPLRGATVRSKRISASKELAWTIVLLFQLGYEKIGKGVPGRRKLVWRNVQRDFRGR